MPHAIIATTNISVCNILLAVSNPTGYPQSFRLCIPCPDLNLSCHTSLALLYLPLGHNAPGDTPCTKNMPHLQALPVPQDTWYQYVPATAAAPVCRRSASSALRLRFLFPLYCISLPFVLFCDNHDEAPRRFVRNILSHRA